MSSRFIVTGASGFIGRRLCAALRGRGRVVALLRDARAPGPWDDVVVADLARDDVPVRPFEGAEVVFHFAGRAHALAERTADVAAYARVNVVGTRRVAQAARAAGVRRFVLASSVKAMGEGDGGLAPLSPYGASKRDAERVVLDRGFAEPVVLRLSLVYGAGVRGNLDAMLRAVMQGRFPPPPCRTNRRAMVHVDDVVRTAVAAGEHARARGMTFVVGDGVPYSTRAIYDAMRRALRMSPRAWSLPDACWRAMAVAGDAWGAVSRRRAPFDSDAYVKLFSSAWYDPDDVPGVLGVPRFLTLDDALAQMVAAL
jgi:nucleoside-diphosphate-sugar epimerase